MHYYNIRSGKSLDHLSDFGLLTGGALYPAF